MINKNKRGQINPTQIIFGALILAVILIAGMTFYDVANDDVKTVDALENSISNTGDFIVTVMGPAMGILLGFDESTPDNTVFLIIITFILISIIIVGTLDSVNIFDANVTAGSKYINLTIGLIVSIIGVRFMPTDIWASLTAPSSAFVATILVGAPFLAMLFVTMKIKYSLARKALWLFYIIFMSYLIFFPEDGFSTSNPFMWIYVLFLIGGIIMLVAEQIIRVKLLQQSQKHAFMETIGMGYSKRMAEIQGEIKELIERSADTNDKALRKTFKNGIEDLKREFEELSGKTYP